MNLDDLDKRVHNEQSKRVARDDRIAFAKLCGITPDAWQSDVLQSQARRMLINCSRQAGKSLTCAILSLHQALYKSNQTILLISPSLRQSGELLRKVTFLMAYLSIPPVLVGDSKSVLEFKNGSRIISLPATESTVRTYTADLIIEDEAGDVDDDLHSAILPMLIVSKGRLILAGTPKGRKGHFFEHWERSNGWEHYTIGWKDCPRISPEEIAEQKLILRDKFAQEYECQFIQGGLGMVYGGFDEQRNLIDALPDDPERPWKYMLGLDFGYKDATAFAILAYRAKDPIAYFAWSHKQTGMIPSAVGAKVLELQAKYNFNRIIGDIGGLGKGYSEEMRQRFHVPVEPALKSNKRGYLDLFNGDLCTGAIKFVRGTNQEYITELVSLPWNDDRSAENPGFPNHICDSGLYVWRACTMYMQKPDKEKSIESAEAKHTREVEEYWKNKEKQIHQEQHGEDYGWIFT